MTRFGLNLANTIVRRLSQESNPEPTDPKSGALSIELLRRPHRLLYSCRFVKDGLDFP